MSATPPDSRRQRGSQGPLCWGQHWSWLLDTAPTRRQSPSATVDTVLPLPPGTTVQTIRSAARLVVGRHESLRSNFFIGPTGLPVQRVRQVSTPPVSITEVPERPHRDVMRVLQRSLPPVTDLATDIPFRMAVGTVRSVPTVALVSVHIVAVDGVSYMLVYQELERFITALNAGRRPAPPPPTWQPLDQAAYEARPEMAARNRRNLQHWSGVFATSPPTTLPFYWENVNGYAPGHHAILASASLGRICAQLAGRSRTSEATVLLTALSILLGSWSGQPRTVVADTSACRYLPQMRSSVGRYKAISRLVVELPEAWTFDELATRVRAASMDASKRSICSEGGVAMAQAKASAESNSQIEQPVHFNFHHYTAGASTVTAALGVDGGDPAVRDHAESVAVPFPIVDVWPLRGGELRIRVLCGRGLLPEGAGGLLRQLDSLLRLAAGRPDTRVREFTKQVSLPRFWGGPGWISVRNSWFSLDDTRRLLLEHPDVYAAGAFLEPPDRSIAYVSGRDDQLSLESLHDYLRDRASSWPTVLLPDKYILCRPGTSADTQQGWAAQVAVASGTGRAAARVTPRSPAEAALASAFAATHPGQELDLSASYAQAGGDFLRVPATILALARLGYGGLTHQDFLGMAPMTRLAMKARRSAPLQAAGSRGAPER